MHTRVRSLTQIYLFQSRILTSATCCTAAKDTADIKVVVGVYEMGAETNDEQAMPVQLFKIHEGFDDLTLTNDICVIYTGVPISIDGIK